MIGYAVAAAAYLAIGLFVAIGATGPIAADKRTAKAVLAWPMVVAIAAMVLFVVLWPVVDTVREAD